MEEKKKAETPPVDFSSNPSKPEVIFLESEGDGEPAEDHEFLRYEPSWHRFPIEAMPLIIRQVVGETAKALAVDPAMVALPALCVMAGCIGSSRVLQIKSTWLEPAILFGCVIGPPSSRKTAAMYAAAAPMMEWNRERQIEYEAAKKKYDADMEEWRLATLADPTAKLTEPTRPIERRALLQNATSEAFLRELEKNPRGMLNLRDELRGWFAGMGQYSKSGADADESLWLEVFMGREYMYDRKMGDCQRIRIPFLGSSVVGTIQPKMWRSLNVRKMFDSGLMARILPIEPEILDGEFDWFEPDPSVTKPYECLIRGLLALDYEETLEQAWKPKPMVFTAPAAKAWEAWIKTARKSQREAEGEIAAMLGKMEAYCARFALIFAVCDRVTRGEGDYVEEHHLASAIALQDWFREEAERVYANTKKTNDEALKETVLRRIRTLGGSITPRDLWVCNRQRWIDTNRARDYLMRLAGLTPDGEEDRTVANPVLELGKRGRFYLVGRCPQGEAEAISSNPAASEFDAFVDAYRMQFLRPDQDDRFVRGWQKHLARYSLEELLCAIEDLAGDQRRLNPRWPGLFVTNHCAFLSEAVNKRRRDTQQARQKAADESPAAKFEPDFSLVEFAPYYTRLRKQEPGITFDAAKERFLASKRASLPPGV